MRRTPQSARPAQPPPGKPVRRLAAALGATLSIVITVTATSASSSPPATAAPRPLPVQLLALNDLHGNLDPVSGAAGALAKQNGDGQVSSVQAGGVPQLATLLDRAREGQSDSVTVGVGDMIGGSPLLSAAFHDEPTVDALETLGLDVSSVGNHEFDEGSGELLRMTDGGCHPKEGCADPDQPYDGADFPYLAANVTREGGKEPILPPYWIKRLPNGERVGFIGLTTQHTPSAVSAAGVRGLEFADERRTIDRYAEELDGKGVKAIVAMVHEGGTRAGKAYDADCDAAGPASALSGPIKQIGQRVSPKVDVILSGHSHEPYTCTVDDPAGNPRPVTQAASFGRAFTDLRFVLDPETRDVVRSSVTARNHLVPTATPRQQAVNEVVERWRARSAELSDEAVGHIEADLPGRGSKEPETPLGDLITDTQVEATNGAGAQLAFLNTGGMRADLTYKAQGKEGDGVVTYGEAFQVQPFDNLLVTMTLTGDQLVQVLREQFSGENAAEPIFLQLSSALRYSADMSRQGAERLLEDTVRVNGKPVTATERYRVTVNSFLADGGNGFATFKKGTDRETGTTDLSAFTEYLRKHTSKDNPLAAPKAERITFR
ncbi:bifunctional metallophosphatase/5'-nucleotidase [Streptomyces armeniacus]|uniref:Bifunctional metallophosphatase/5'-nucleotidase n=1 Tax=Streptomyces armeniacus TaxID=83291 RepID=A0A345XJE0_9ACTN|nr:bifunctional metallophosphatase/5'-nucleotidase [Streptomyces armeniacus]AXK31756.1 bifunctional metallophosphatase/5'-nucleotidase [Streptomyces armeniacus]